MTSRLDLHLHTTASDGAWPPRELVRAAADRGVTLLAVTDHDTTDGVPEALTAGRALGVKVVPGVELSADSERHDIHLLGFYLPRDDADLQAALRRVRLRRAERNAHVLEKLRELGVPVEAERLQRLGGHGSVGRPHIAAAMIERGYVTSQGEAFHRYLARGKPAFVPRVRLSAADACRIITRAGGLPVLAHPGKIGSWEVVEEVLSHGAQGVEAFHSDHTLADTQRLVSLARARGLVVTGGSDAHGPRSDRPGDVGSVSVPAWVRVQFLERAPAWWTGLWA